MQQRHEAVAVHARVRPARPRAAGTSGRGRCSAPPGARSVPCGTPGPGDDQRHADVGVERGLLAHRQPVLAEVVAVVGAEHDVGVVESGARARSCASTRASSLSTASTDCARMPEVASIRAICAGIQRRALAEPLRRVHVLRVERRIARLAQAGEVVRVARRRRVRLVRRERRDLERERRAPPLDEVQRVARRARRRRSCRAAASACRPGSGRRSGLRAVVVEDVVELGVPVRLLTCQSAHPAARVRWPASSPGRRSR